MIPDPNNQLKQEDKEEKNQNKVDSNFYQL
jgi:hypothetical protein